VRIFSKRRALDPLVVVPLAGMPGETEQGNSSGETIRASKTSGTRRRRAQHGWFPHGGERL
jgi:hypothetical protein